MVRALKWLWQRFGDYLAAIELWKIVASSTAISAILGPLAIRIFTPLSAFDFAVVAAIFGAAAFGLAVHFCPKVRHVHHMPLTAENHTVASLTATKLRALSAPQKQLLRLIWKYQEQFASSKLVIDRETGGLHFDASPGRGSDVSLIKDLYGIVDQEARVRFVDLMEGMPPEYLTFLPEMRWDNPFVVRLTDAANVYLHSNPI